MSTSDMRNNPLLRMTDIRIEGFSDERWHPIIKGIDLQLERGQILGLIGESGAGKSTLGLAAMGFARPGCRFTGGRVEFDGTDLLSLKESQRRKLWGTRIAYVAQSAAAAFNPAHRLIDQTIESASRFKLRTESESKQDAIELYDALHLPDPRNARPDLIIFDEPTTALDVTTQVEVLSAMREIVEQYHTAAIYITHDLAVVAQMADVIKVLRHGEEVEQAETRTMLTSPEEEYTKSLWSVRSIDKPEQRSDDIVLALKEIDAAYGKSKVLHGINIELPRGKTVAVVGESGSGKSTAARVITGLLPQRAGTVSFNGELLPAKLADRTPDQLRRIQMIYQMADTAMNPRQTVENIIARPLEFFHQMRGQQKEQRLLELMSMIELDESNTASAICLLPMTLQQLKLSLMRLW